MRCPKCGTEYQDGTNFCRYCGSKLYEEKTEPSGGSDAKVDRSSGWLVAVIVAVSIAIVGIAGFLLYKNVFEPMMSGSGSDQAVSTEATEKETKTKNVTEAEPTEPSTAAPTEPPTDPMVKVPNCVGMKSIDAYNTITSLGLKNKVEFDYSDSIPEDRVISQSPAEDTEVKQGATIELKVSRGVKPTSAPATAAPTIPAVSNNSDTTDRYGLRVSYRYITRSDISWMTLEEVQLAINEVYAKLGFKFGSGIYKTYFESMDWYHPDTTSMYDIEDRMNDYEVQNMKVMGEYRDYLKKNR